MRAHKFRLAICSCVFIFGAASVWSQNLIRVYVQAGDGEFASNSVRDSAMDLRKALLSKSSNLRVVESASEADIVVRIDARKVRKETDRVNTYVDKSKDGRSATATTVPQVSTVNVLHATILVGASEVPIKAESSFSWRLAAGNLASAVERWVNDNNAKLMARRSQQGDSTTAPASPPAPAGSATNSSQETTITPGMSESQVLNAMGAPEKKVAFGTKSLWTYRGMQVVFENGKVTDVKF